jgi:hypothetical protein
VHQVLNTNKGKTYRCDNSQPTELEDGIRFDNVDLVEFDSANKDEDEDQQTEPSLSMRSGKIPTVEFFFDLS